MHRSTPCQNCGNHVSAAFARVFGNDENEVYACRNCNTMRNIKRCAATAPDAEGQLMVSVRADGGAPRPARLQDDTDENEADEETVFLRDVTSEQSAERDRNVAAADEPRHDDPKFAALLSD